LHIYFESEDHENDLHPGTFAGLAVIGDEDGSHLAFIVCGQVIADLRMPPGVMWEIWNAIGNAVTDSGRAAEYESDDWKTEVTAGRQAAPLPVPARQLPPAVPPPPVVPPPPGPVAGGGHVFHHPPGNAYGPYEVPPAARVLPAGPVQRGPEPDGPPINHTRPLPVCTSGSRLRRTG